MGTPLLKAVERMPTGNGIAHMPRRALLHAHWPVIRWSRSAVGEIASAVWETSTADNSGDLNDQWVPVQLVRPGVLLVGAVMLVAPADVSGLARAMEASIAMSADERRWRTVRAARAARACFGLDVFRERTLRVYRELLP